MYTRMMETPRYPHRRLKTIPAWLALTGLLALGLAACDEGIEPGGANTQGATSSEASTPPPAPPSTYRLSNDGKTLVDAAGSRIRVNPKLVTGYVDNATPNGDALDLSGWAAPADLSRPADAVVAIVGKKSVTAVVPSGDRPDLVDGYDRPGLAKAGYVLSLPKSALDCSAADQGLKTFAVVGKAAAPLEWLADVPEHIADAC
jgi:hypothetical protein